MLSFARRELEHVSAERLLSGIGLPDVAALGKLVLTVAWQTWPDGTQNPAFIAEATAQGLKPGQSVYLSTYKSGEIVRGGVTYRLALETDVIATLDDVSMSMPEAVVHPIMQD